MKLAKLNARQSTKIVTLLQTSICFVTASKHFATLRHCLLNTLLATGGGRGAFQADDLYVIANICQCKLLIKSQKALMINQVGVDKSTQSQVNRMDIAIFRKISNKLESFKN